MIVWRQHSPCKTGQHRWRFLWILTMHLGDDGYCPHLIRVCETCTRLTR